MYSRDRGLLPAWAMRDVPVPGSGGGPPRFCGNFRPRSAMNDESKKQTAQTEGRGQPRIQAQVPIRITAPGSDKPQQALLLNLSWGGALIRCGELPGEPGTGLDIELPYHQHAPIRLGSEILRTSRAEDGRHLVAVRFSSVSPEAENHLEKVLVMLLSGKGGGRREHPRLVQRLEIYFDDPADVRATLEDISHGGLAVTVPYSFSVGQSVQLTVFGGAALGEVRLRARVVNQTLLEDGKLTLYRIGLKFEHSGNDLRDLVDGLLRKLASREALAARKWEAR